MIGIYKGSPAIYDPVSGKCAVVFPRTAAGWSRAVKLAVEVSKELRREDVSR